MIDSFLFLAPLLLLPIAFYVLFVGCDAGEITNVNWVEGEFVISFYLDDPVLLAEGHTFRFQIFDAQSNEVAGGIYTVEPSVPTPAGQAVPVRRQFSYFLQPGTKSLSCRVLDAASGDPVVTSGAAICTEPFANHEQYLIFFEAGVDDSGNVPETAFTWCLIEQAP